MCYFRTDADWRVYFAPDVLRRMVININLRHGRSNCCRWGSAAEAYAALSDNTRRRGGLSSASESVDDIWINDCNLYLVGCAVRRAEKRYTPWELRLRCCFYWDNDRYTVGMVGRLGATNREEPKGAGIIRCNLTTLLRRRAPCLPAFFGLHHQANSDWT